MLGLLFKTRGVSGRDPPKGDVGGYPPPEGGGHPKKNKDQKFTRKRVTPPSARGLCLGGWVCVVTDLGEKPGCGVALLWSLSVRASLMSAESCSLLRGFGSSFFWGGYLTLGAYWKILKDLIFRECELKAKMWSGHAMKIRGGNTIDVPK